MANPSKKERPINEAAVPPKAKIKSRKPSVADFINTIDPERPSRPRDTRRANSKNGPILLWINALGSSA